LFVNDKPPYSLTSFTSNKVVLVQCLQLQKFQSKGISTDLTPTICSLEPLTQWFILFSTLYLFSN